MNISIEKTWIPVSHADFEDFLKTCDDYVRECWCGGEHYSFRRMMGREERFATATKDAVYVKPSLIKESA